jgi:hypothetical protein
MKSDDFMGEICFTVNRPSGTGSISTPSSPSGSISMDIPNTIASTSTPAASFSSMGSSSSLLTGDYEIRPDEPSRQWYALRSESYDKVKKVVPSGNITDIYLINS